MNTAKKKVLSAVLAASLAMTPLLSLAETGAVDAVSGATTQTEDKQTPSTRNAGKRAAPDVRTPRQDDSAMRGQKGHAKQTQQSLYAAFAKTLLNQGIINRETYNQILAYLNISTAATPAEDAAASPGTAGT